MERYPSSAPHSSFRPVSPTPSSSAAYADPYRGHNVSPPRSPTSRSESSFSAVLSAAHEHQLKQHPDGVSCAQRPSPTQPFGEYVSQSMFLGARSPIGVVASCCATLFLSRANPQLLEDLTAVFAKLFPIHKQEIMRHFREAAERKSQRLGLTGDPYCTTSAPPTPSRRGSAVSLLNASCNERDDHGTAMPSWVNATAPSSPATVVTGPALTLLNEARNHQRRTPSPMGEGDRNKTRSPVTHGSTPRQPGGPTHLTTTPAYLPRDPSSSTATGAGSSDPPSVNRTTSYQLVDDEHTDTHSRRSDSHHTEHARLRTCSEFVEELHPQPTKESPAVLTHTSIDAANLAAGGAVSSSGVSLGEAPTTGSGSVSPCASSHSTIQPLLRQPSELMRQEPAKIVDFFLSMVQGMVNLYFSYNWDVVDDVLQINQQYMRYVEQTLIPRIVRWIRARHEGLVTPLMSQYEAEKKKSSAPAKAIESLPVVTGPAVTTSDNKSTLKVVVEQPAAAVGAVPHSTPTAATTPQGDFLNDHANLSDWAGRSSDSMLDSRAASLVFHPSPTSSTAFATREDVQDYDGVLFDGEQIPFTVVTSENVAEFLTRGERSPLQAVVLFFHVPFSLPSCAMWEILASIQQEYDKQPPPADAGAAPIIGVVYGVSEVELSDAFSVTWYPTVILIPSGGAGCARVSSLIHRYAAEVEMRKVDKDLHAVNALPCLSGSPSNDTAGDHNDCVGDPDDGTVEQRVLSPRRSDGLVGACDIGGFDTTDEAELQMAARGSSSVVRSRAASPAVACCEAVSETKAILQQRMLELEAVVGRSPTPQRGSRTPAAATDEEGTAFFRFPEKGLVVKDPVWEWLRGEGRVEAKQRKVKAWITRLVTLTAQMKYRPVRQLHSAIVMLKKLQGAAKDSGNHLVFKDDGQIEFEGSTKAHTSADDPPFFIFLGGGMAAGKTTAATALARTDWWKDHKDQLVVVDADTFKMADPIRNAKPSDLHEKSTKSAEKLLVTALNQGRSVIFDGTMMWAPFVEQTAAMVRQAHTHHFSMGPGFDEKQHVEQYWQVGEPRKVPLVPYHILFLAITVEPHEAVPRGILRGVTTGRTVPIRGQLRSFRLFSEAFEGYAKLCDEVTLYNNNIRVDLDQGQLPPCILRKEARDQELLVEDEFAYRNFKRHRLINDRATCCDEIYHPSSAAARQGESADPLSESGALFSASASFSTPQKFKRDHPLAASSSS